MRIQQVNEVGNLKDGREMEQILDLFVTGLGRASKMSKGMQGRLRGRW
jgi:hypothetical protein